MKTKTLKIIGAILGLLAAGAATIFIVLPMLSDSDNQNKKPNIHSLSSNEAVSMGLSNMLSEVSALADTKDVKNETDISLDIYRMPGGLDLSGLTLSLNMQADSTANQYKLSAKGALNNMVIFSGQLYADDTEMVGYIPMIYAGAVVMPYEFLDKLQSMIEDMSADIDTDNSDDLSNSPTMDISNMELPEFDYDKFIKGLADSMEPSINSTTSNIEVTELGKQPLSSGDYYCYKATIPVKDLADIVKTGILYALNNKELQDYLDAVYSSATEEDVDDELIYDYDIDMSSQMSSYAMILDSYWPLVVSELENTLGTNIEFTVYLSEDVKVVGYQLSIPSLFTFQSDFTDSMANGDSVAYYDFTMYEGDDTLLDLRLSVSTKELTDQIEIPSAEPVLNLNELSDEELTAIMNSVSMYMELFGALGHPGIQTPPDTITFLPEV